MTTYSETDYLDLAELAVEDARKMPYWDPEEFTGNEDDDRDDFVSMAGRHRDSTLLEDSNFESIQEAMTDQFPEDDVFPVSFGHWGVGWIEELMVRIYQDSETKAEVTAAFKEAVAIRDAMSEYPVFDETDFSQREYSAATEAIMQEGSIYVAEGSPDDWAEKVWRWLWENDQEQLEDVDGQGGHPSDESIQEALWALDMLDEEYHEDDEGNPRKIPPDPSQLKLPGLDGVKAIKKTMALSMACSSLWQRQQKGRDS